MAAIQEVLTLVDHFTAPFTSYISMAERAAGASSAVRRAAERMGSADFSGLPSGMTETSSAAREAAAAMRQASQAAEAARAHTAGAFSGNSEQVRAYARELLSVKAQLQRAHVELNVHQRMLAACVGGDNPKGPSVRPPLRAGTSGGRKPEGGCGNPAVPAYRRQRCVFYQRAGRCGEASGRGLPWHSGYKSPDWTGGYHEPDHCPAEHDERRKSEHRRFKRHDF